MNSLFARLLLGLVFTLSGIDLCAQEITIRPDRESGIYRPGESVTWNVEVKAEASTPQSLRYRIKSGGLSVIREETLELTTGRGTVQARSDSPGWLLLEVQGQDQQGKEVTARGGALFSPSEIRPSAPVPADFDAFWEAKLGELAAVPADPQIQPAASGTEGIDYFLIEMKNIRGSRIRGQLARPSKPGPLPALLIVQWAGVYPLEKAWVIDRAKEGWLTLNIQAHDLPAAEPGDFYKDQGAGPLKDYSKIGNEDRDTSYFLRMYLSCYRAAEYLSHRSDWDGRTLAVTGGSQGGLQAILTAALHPRVTAVLADVPAGCDQTGPDVGRAPGWPMWVWSAEGRDAAKVKEASRYYDIVNFAPRVSCPVLVGIGLVDTVCPPAGVYAACNQLKGPKELILMPSAGHQGKHEEYGARWTAWLEELRRGNRAPVAQPAEPPISWVDPDTGHRVVRLTREPGSASLYFNQNGYTPDGKKLIYTTPGGICTLDLATQESRRVVESPARLIEAGRKTGRIYYIREGALFCTDIESAQIRKIAALPPRGSISTINADETLAAGTFIEGTGQDYGGNRAQQTRSLDQPRNKGQMMEERWAARLPMALFTIDIASGETKTIHRSNDWLNHLLFSPADPSLLMFCHEGPWHKVDRIWTIRTDGTQLRKIHTRTMAMEIFGHEFWGADGKTIWYDLQTPRGEDFWLAGFRLDTGERTWYHLERNEWSIHFNVMTNGTLFCGDGGDPGQVARATNGQWIYLFRPELLPNRGLEDGNLVRPGVLRSERLVNMSKHQYRLEPNVSFSPDQKWVVFRSNMFGPTYVFAVEVAKTGVPSTE